MFGVPGGHPARRNCWSLLGLFEELQRDVVRVAEAENSRAQCVMLTAGRYARRRKRVRQAVEVSSAGTEGDVVQADPVLAEPVRIGIAGRRAEHQPGPGLADPQAQLRAGEVLVYLESEDALIEGTGSWQVRDVQRHVMKPGQH